MTDNVPAHRRSEIMASIGQKDTKPEMLVRRYLHRHGYRYRLHVAELPGKPDLVFAGKSVVLFINGCFWHGHKDPSCKLSRIPKSNVAFWKAKIAANQRRDRRNVQDLEDQGWKVFVVWECQLRKPDFMPKLARELDNFGVD